MINRYSKRAMLVMAMIMMLTSSMNALAAPKTMPDGSTFDAEYYADANPDVVAAVGVSEEALYNHYVTYGQREGRAAFVGQEETKATSGNPGIIDKVAKAYSENDYVTIYSFSKNFSTYSKELAPYMTAKSSRSQRYNFDTAYGKLIIVTFSGDDYKLIVNMGLVFHDAATGNAIAAQTNADNARRRANWGWKLCSHCVYGTDFLIQQDRWTEYVLCYNGYEYMEVSTDGQEYSNYKNYPDRPIGGQAASMHFCIGD